MIELLAVPALITLGAAGLELAERFDWKPAMARVRMFGQEFTATVLKDNGDGTYQMEAKQHTARTAVGTIFTAKSSEVTEMAAAEAPDDGSGALNAAMAEERRTITPASEILAAHNAAVAAERAKQAATDYTAPVKSISIVTTGVSVPPGPTGALLAPNPQEKPMTHLADKMKALAQGTSGFVAALEAKVDGKMVAHAKAQTDISNKVDDAFAAVDAITADAQAGVDAITSELAKLTN